MQSIWRTAVWAGALAVACAPSLAKPGAVKQGDTSDKSFREASESPYCCGVELQSSVAPTSDTFGRKPPKGYPASPNPPPGWANHASPAPEPDAYAMWAVGLVAVYLLRRRMRSKAGREANNQA